MTVIASLISLISIILRVFLYANIQWRQYPTSTRQTDKLTPGAGAKRVDKVHITECPKDVVLGNVAIIFLLEMCACFLSLFYLYLL